MSEIHREMVVCCCGGCFLMDVASVALVLVVNKTRMDPMGVDSNR